MSAVYHDRKNLVMALRDVESVIDALHTFFSFGSFFIMLFVFQIVFSQGSNAQLFVSAGTSFLAFSFLFADTARQLFSAFIFVFVRCVRGCFLRQLVLTLNPQSYPFDVGDRVTIDLDGTTMYVKQINLFNTTVRFGVGGWGSFFFDMIIFAIFFSFGSGTDALSQ